MSPEIDQFVLIRMAVEWTRYGVDWFEWQSARSRYPGARAIDVFRCIVGGE